MSVLMLIRDMNPLLFDTELSKTLTLLAPEPSLDMTGHGDSGT
jgi:hypothetical protein